MITLSVVLLFLMKKENISIIKNHTASINMIKTEQTHNHIIVESFHLEDATKGFFE